jgi:hypothetical protein
MTVAGARVHNLTARPSAVVADVWVDPTHNTAEQGAR